VQKSAKILRRIALVFFLGVTATIVTTIPASPHPFAQVDLSGDFNFALFSLRLAVPKLHAGLHATVLGFQFLVAVGNTSNGVALSSVAIGYVFSFIAARITRADRSWHWYACLLLSGLGLLGFVNEGLRLLTHQDLRFLVSCPPLLALFDWLHSRHCNRAKPALLTPLSA
jgi:hypothetical protein